MCIFSSTEPSWLGRLPGQRSAQTHVAETRIFARVEDDTQWIARLDYLHGSSPRLGRSDPRAQRRPMFKAAITSKLAAIGRSDLSANNILARAATQSCGGCHQPSLITAPVGGSMTFPSSNGFTQIDENGTLSTALTTVFLPHRKAVLDAFLAAPAAAIADAMAADNEAIGGDAAN